MKKLLYIIVFVFFVAACSDASVVYVETNTRHSVQLQKDEVLVNVVIYRSSLYLLTKDTVTNKFYFRLSTIPYSKFNNIVFEDTK